MKKCLSLILAVLLLLASCAAAETPAGYPAVKIDPKTGKAYDLGGRSVTIYDYWSGDGLRVSEPSEEHQARYDYEDWLMETYNCSIIQKQGGDWGTCADVMRDFVAAPDGSLRIYIIEPAKATALITEGVAADWNRSVTVDTSDAQWNQAVREFTSVAGGTYGLSANGEHHEPRDCVFFNKRLLTEAGIDWNTIYDMQSEGSWTWENFAKYLDKAAQDTDNDGVTDVYAMTGMESLFYQMSVFSNGGDFFHYDENGDLVPGMTGGKTIYALEWAQDIWGRYARPCQEGENWDYYKTVWANGGAAFYIGQTYEGFYAHSEMAYMDDQWGCVAFPIGPSGSTYLTTISENLALIPNVYDDKDLALISMIYDLWNRPTPGYDDENAWIDIKYELTDDRAVEETYAMLREPDHAIIDLTTLLGTANDVLGVSLLWSLQSGSTVWELIEAGLPEWQRLCDELNETRQLTVDLSGYDTMELPADLAWIEDGAFIGTDAQVIVIPDGCMTIEANVFANCPRLLYVVIPSSVTSISPNAFSGCSTLQRVLVYHKSYASQYCWENGLTCLYLAQQQLSASPRVWTIELD